VFKSTFGNVSDGRAFARPRQYPGSPEADLCNRPVLAASRNQGLAATKRTAFGLLPD
jgi:hypothetical protein